jgi:hypothetical protein
MITVKSIVSLDLIDSCAKPSGVQRRKPDKVRAILPWE